MSDSEISVRAKKKRKVEVCQCCNRAPVYLRSVFRSVSQTKFCGNTGKSGLTKQGSW